MSYPLVSVLPPEREDQSMAGTVPSAVVKRSERARKAGWTDAISLRVRNGRTSVLHRLWKDHMRVATNHLDGKAQYVYFRDAAGMIQRSSFPDLDALIRCEHPERHPAMCRCVPPGIRKLAASR